MRVVQIHSTDGGGGGAVVAYHLMDLMSEFGIESELFVGIRKYSNDPRVKYISERVKSANVLANILPFPGRIKSAVRVFISTYTIPLSVASKLTGKEYAKTYNSDKFVEEILKLKPDIVHCHNLHSDYFDLSALIRLSNEVPTVLTLHDAWLLTGHCAHFFDCQKWKTGCDGCPNLSVYPSIRRDAAGYNWSKRADIYKQCRLYVASPSAWMIDCANESILSRGIVKSKVIPNGIDLNVFHPGNKDAERFCLSLPKDRFIIVFSAAGLKNNDFKDYRMLRSTLKILSDAGEDILCLALGDSGDTENIGKSVEIRFIPFISDQRVVAQYYRACDVYVHPARAETSPLAIIESESCGVPVVASAVGGIPELIEDGKSGYLISKGNAAEMAEKIVFLKNNEKVRAEMGDYSQRIAKERYGDDLMAERYLEFYNDILNTL